MSIAFVLSGAASLAAIELGADEIYVLPTGGPCALTEALEQRARRVVPLPRRRKLQRVS